MVLNNWQFLIQDITVILPSVDKEPDTETDGTGGKLGSTMCTMLDIKL